MDFRWIPFLAELGVSTVPVAVVLLIVIFLGRQLIVYFFGEAIEVKKLELSKSLENNRLDLNKQLEMYRNELAEKTEVYKNNLNRLLETHKSELNLINLKTSKLYEKQSLVIAELYKLISRLNRSFNDMTALMKFVVSDSEKEEQERINKATKDFNAFIEFFTDNRIFFSESICVDIDNLSNLYRDVHWDYLDSKNYGNTEFLIKKGLLDEVRKKTQEVIPPILSNLQSQFRNILSVK
ncbi:hypothetical protein [Spirosoma pollinicola]|uniref:Uncharacterized protein n=1 Tax=Spirosoma pollinicola TaxID=2057025 RepID=A0A2K8YTC9_9BACT|nr:hypothetical protein [Spirosoma pollinicola]AUD00881.1 hypothetical protein CWM47_03050 [Spirosoma pollinicola]